MRYYPYSLPAYLHEPTSEHFEVRYISEREGEGVVSLASFEPGDVVFVFTGFLIHEITQYTLQIEDGLYIHDPFFMGKVLHSCDPNCSVDMKTLTFTANRPIRPGDLVTMDYETTEDYLFKSFECNCRAPNCRGLIAGRLNH